VFVVYFVGNGLCDELITRAGESYLVVGGACVRYFKFFLTQIVGGYFPSYISGALLYDSERSNRKT